MSTTLQAARLRAPLPRPRPYSLLDAANIVASATDRWMAGVAGIGYPAGPAYVYEGCATGTYRLKEEGGVIASAEGEAFTVYLPVSCTSRSIASAIDAFRDTLNEAFKVYEPTAVELVLADGGGVVDQYLGDSNMELLAAAAVTPLEGLALLEGAIPYGNGIIHVPPETASVWASEGYIQARGSQMVTKLGTTVAVGFGYQGVRPDGQAAPTASNQWAFASGPIDIYRAAQPIIQGFDPSEGLDRSNNDWNLLEEREYLLLWVGRGDDTSQVQAGVLIDRIP